MPCTYQDPPHQDPPQAGNGWALVAAAAVVGLIAATCAVLFEFSGARASGDESLTVLGWMVAIALTVVALLADYWLLLGVCRATGLKINMRRLEAKPPIPAWRYMAIFITASIVAIAGIFLVQQLIPLGPVRSEILLLTIGGSAAPLEFADLKANRAYWMGKIEEADAAGPWSKGEGGTA